MNILLICMIPVCIIATGFLVLKSVQLGLKWQIQTKEGKEPKLDTPITQIKASIDNKNMEESMKNQTKIINEWLYGK